MPVESTILAYHGDAPTEAAITGITIAYKRADDDDLGATDPIHIPLTGTTRSWRKSMRITFPVPVPARIENLRKFWVGAWPGGVRLLAKLAGAYTEASETDEAMNVLGMTDASLFTDSTPLVVNAGLVLPVGVSGVGEQQFVETQLVVESAASPGAAGPVVGVYRWDEI